MQCKDKKEICVGDYFLPTTSPVPLKYDSLLLNQKKLTHYISMELKKKLTSVKYEETITLVTVSLHNRMAKGL